MSRDAAHPQAAERGGVPEPPGPAGLNVDRGRLLPLDFARLGMLVLPWLAALVLAVVIAQRVTVTGPAGMSLPRATFFVASAASLTGFEATWAHPTSLTPAHTVVAAVLLAWTAVLGTVIATAAFVRVSGRRWGWGRIVAVSAAFLTALAILAFAAELLAGRNAGAAAWNAAMVATATGALTEPTAATQPLLWFGHFPLAALAALGPFVLVDTLRRRGAPLAPVTRLTWTAVPLTFLVALLLVVAAAGLNADVAEAAVTALDAPDRAVAALDGSLTGAAVAAVDARGAGFTDAAGELPHAARWTLIPILLLGGASGGVGGGLKAVTAAVLVLGIARLVRGGSAGRTFAIAAIWLAALVALFAITFVLLIHTSPQLRPDRAAILAAAACGNAGVSVDPVTAAGADAYVLAAAMLLGRVLPWVVLWWSATRGDEAVAVG